MTVIRDRQAHARMLEARTTALAQFERDLRHFRDQLDSGAMTADGFANWAHYEAVTLLDKLDYAAATYEQACEAADAWRTQS